MELADSAEKGTKDVPEAIVVDEKPENEGIKGLFQLIKFYMWAIISILCIAYGFEWSTNINNIVWAFLIAALEKDSTVEVSSVKLAYGLGMVVYYFFKFWRFIAYMITFGGFLCLTEVVGSLKAENIKNIKNGRIFLNGIWTTQVSMILIGWIVSLILLGVACFFALSGTGWVVVLWNTFFGIKDTGEIYEGNITATQHLKAAYNITIKN